MSRILMPMVMATLILLLAGCVSFFAQSVKYNSDVVSAAGTITISDPKLFSREMLINERAREVSRIQKLIDEVNSVEFKPDIYREVEQITAFSAALGLKFDPAVETNYRNAQETNNVQQEINTLRLQLQLEQLRRDAELLREKLPKQTEPVNNELGEANSDGLTAVNSGISAAAPIEQLKGQIDRLLEAMKGSFGSDAKPVAVTTVSANPFDKFRDQQAYLDMLRSARNATALDELHDSNNTALIRLNFQATVIPDPSYPRSLGAVQIKVDSSTLDDKAEQKFLSDWLDHINTKRDARKDGIFKQISEIQDLKRLRILETVFAKGVKVDKSEKVYEFVFPATTIPDFSNGLDEAFESAEWNGQIGFSSSQTILSSLDSNEPVFEALCDTSLAINLEQTWQNRYRKLKEEIYIARARVLTYPHLIKLKNWLIVLDPSSKYAPDYEMKFVKSVEFLDGMRNDLKSIAKCDGYAEQLPKQSPINWGSLADEVAEAAQENGVRVYEVGPREQVQQMSTVARSASSLALAASIAAAAPGSGAAADAALGYSKQAMGRATTLERIPSVVGYTVGGKQTFGWVLGPRPALDPKGTIDVEQMLKPYDLTVDMSVPMGWSKLRLNITKLWGPSPHHLVNGNLVVKDTDIAFIEIDLPRRAQDFDWFTQQLTGQYSRVTIEHVKGGIVSACAPSTLLVTGRNIWRAEKVLILGQLLDGSAITITPDMRGILLNVPAIPPLVGQQREKLLHVITPLGRHHFDIEYADTPSGDDCKSKKVEAAPDPNRIVIEKISPDLHFSVPAKFEITVDGKNLDKVTVVKLHGQKGALELKDGRLVIKFSEEDTKSIPADAKLEFFKDKGTSADLIDTRLVRITRQGGG